MKTGDDGNPNDKFGAFLKKHRAPSSLPPKGESDQIWRSIEASELPAWGLRRWFQMMAATAAIAIISFAYSVGQVSAPVKMVYSEVDSGAVSGAEVVEQALELDFIDNGEIYEVAELAELGD